MDHKIYDFIGIGIGPYNLSLAALTEDMDDLDRILFDQTPKMEWHPGMLIEGTDLQVPFMADLVTFADPTSRFSFLNYIKEQERLYKFFFFHEMKAPRNEYNDYLQWAVNQISGLFFGKEVVDLIDHSDQKEPYYELVILDTEKNQKEYYYARHVVMATGSEPLIIDSMEGFPNEDIIHTSRYLYEKEALKKSNHIAIIGSGQSAAEIFYDLLEEREHAEFHLSWLTRSDGIFQRESANLGQEFFSPDYIDYFHQLPFKKRMEAIETLSPLRHGIDYSTLNGIYQLLYHYSIGNEDPRITIQPLTEINGIKKADQGYLLKCKQLQQEIDFDYHAEKVILATGYKPNLPDWFLNRYKDEIEWEDENLFKVRRNYELIFKEPKTNKFYIVTNLEHSHGTAATNLGLAVQRNMEIINDITGEPRFHTEGRRIFQQFLPKR
ncbi:lysine N(6)-hydroxylase/L-ornithine N(5)-oxygenase family protein [Tenuibacillus multivorans]|uniref:L-lysine N6-monooxygenase MbtG n=1 Tax=Tenuibacillus multivorans TaxID=237069 RepID=A0A1G9W3Q1_9BACI|nr:SidA/IucD/PvdA family monooxygenase [Tenuibacillus multivorans]GEL78747.1 lysine 6-monooxygenase [Tenuibacillus multivorans]SDM78817.1 lysine N6-hydroxylase [Tenuibacillus multivorans]